MLFIKHRVHYANKSNLIIKFMHFYLFSHMALSTGLIVFVFSSTVKYSVKISFI